MPGVPQHLHWSKFAFWSFWNLFGFEYLCFFTPPDVLVSWCLCKGWRGRWPRSRKRQLRVGGHDWMKPPEDVAKSWHVTTRHGFAEINFQSLFKWSKISEKSDMRLFKTTINLAPFFFVLEDLQMLQDRFPGTWIWGKRFTQYGSLSGCLHFQALWHLADWISTFVSCGQWLARLMA